jgi:sugar lactone lactonase YvrE
MRISASDEVLRPQVFADPALGRVTAWAVRNKVGESPAWRETEQALYWIDVRAPELLRLAPREDSVRRWRLPDVVGALALKKNGALWLALRDRLAEFDPATGQLRDIAAVEPELATNRLNDGKVSPSGRWFVFGSMDDRPAKQPTGGLFRAGADGSVVKLLDGLVVANGIAFSLDGQSLFFSDSSRGLVMRAPWNEATGDIGAAGIVAMLGEEAGRPDGAAIDGEGCYWSAGVSAGVLNRLDGNGAPCARLPLPVRAPTMPAYGGRERRTMFVTSLVRPQWTAAQPLDGALIAFDSPVPGPRQAEMD